MNFENLHKQVVTFVAACVLFMGSFAYVVSATFKNKDAIEDRQNIAATDEYADLLQ